MGKYLTPDAPPANEYVCRRLRIPASAEFLSLVSGAIASLLFESAWEQHGNMTPADTAQLFKRMWVDKEDEQGCMIGEIKSFLRTELPAHVLPCDGGFYLRVEYPALYEVLPAQFIFDGDTFQTPDLSRLGLVGAGGGKPEGTYELAESGGAESIIQTEDQLASHLHLDEPHNHTDLGHEHFYNAPGITLPGVSPGEVLFTAPSILPSSTTPSLSNLQPANVAIQPTGGSQPMDIRNPFFAVNWGIVAR